MSRSVLLLLAASGVVGCMTPIAADSAVDKTIVYVIRQRPDDPDSPRRLTISVGLREEHRSGHSVAWRVRRIAIQSCGPDGRTWFEKPEDVPLWWTRHANPDRPLLAEFADIPTLSGRARDGRNELDYSFSGKVNSTSPELYGGRSSLMSFSLVRDDATVLGQEDEEPAEIDESGDPPGGS